MKLGSGKIRRLAERRASGGVGVGETPEPKGLTQTTPPGAFHIDQGLSSSGELEARIKRENYGSSLLGGMLEAVRTTVLGGKSRMPLEDGISLAGDPKGGCLRMGEDSVLTSVVANLSVGDRSPRHQPTNRWDKAGDQQPSENASHPIFWCCNFQTMLTRPAVVSP